MTGYNVEGTMARTILQEPDVIPAIMRTLIDKGIPVDGGAAASKAGTFEIETDGVDFVSARYLPPPT